MEKRIYYYLITLTSLIVIITALVMTLLFHDFYMRSLSKQLTFISFMAMFLPAVVGILVILLVFMYIFSSRLTSSILKPLHNATKNIESILSDEDVEYESSYEELEPFIRTIQYQKKEIEKSIMKLKEAEKYRREFTANVSHELKTPLTSINGYAEMIGEGIANEEDTVRFAKIIQKEGARLLDLIDSIIVLSRLEELEEDKTNMSMEPLNLFDLSKSVYGRFEHIAKEKMINIAISGENVVINGNRRMLEDLISNLIDNSIKYNKPNGKVNISINKSEKAAIFRISDTGIGIPMEDQDRILERFYRVDKSRSKRITGSGIGLSIVKHVVEYHNGKIDIKSKIDKGTKFEISFPLK